MLKCAIYGVYAYAQMNVLFHFSKCSLRDHTSNFLSDLHDPKSPTWWQSETIYEGIQYPTAVNLTLSLGLFTMSILCLSNIVHVDDIT